MSLNVGSHGLSFRHDLAYLVEKGSHILVSRKVLALLRRLSGLSAGGFDWFKSLPVLIGLKSYAFECFHRINFVSVVKSAGLLISGSLGVARR